MWAVQIIAVLCLGTTIGAQILYSGYNTNIPMTTYTPWMRNSYTPWVRNSYTPWVRNSYTPSGRNSYTPWVRNSYTPWVRNSYTPWNTYMERTSNRPYPSMNNRFSSSTGQSASSVRFTTPERMEPYRFGYYNDISLPPMQSSYREAMTSSTPYVDPSVRYTGEVRMRGSGMASSRTSNGVLTPSSSSSGMIAATSVDPSSSASLSSPQSVSLSTKRGLSGSASSGLGVSGMGNVGMVGDAGMSMSGSRAISRGMDMRGLSTGMRPSMDMKGYYTDMGPVYPSRYDPYRIDDNGDDNMEGYYNPGSLYGYRGYMGRYPQNDGDDAYDDMTGQYEMYRPNIGYRNMGRNRGYFRYNNMVTPYTGYSNVIFGQPNLMNGGFMYANNLPMTSGVYVF